MRVLDCKILSLRILRSSCQFNQNYINGVAESYATSVSMYVRSRHVLCGKITRQGKSLFGMRLQRLTADG